MVEWGISPIDIVDTWTEEMMDLMIDKMIERKRRESKAWESTSSSAPKQDHKFVPIEEFARKLGRK